VLFCDFVHCILWRLKKNKWLFHPFRTYERAYPTHPVCALLYMMHIIYNIKDDRALLCRDNDIHTPCRNTIAKYINLQRKGASLSGETSGKQYSDAKSPVAQMYSTTPTAADICRIFIPTPHPTHRNFPANNFIQLFFVAIAVSPAH